MPKALFAEWLLKRVSSPQRAFEIIGDLIEQNTSQTRFWFTIIRILLAFTWRWAFGFVLAGLLAIVLLVPFTLSVIPKRDSVQLHPWMLLAACLAAAAISVGTTMALAICRYGLRDRLTWMSFCIWATLIVCTSLAWLPHASLFVALLLGAGAITPLLSSKTRGLFLCVVVPTVAYAATSAVFIQLSRFTYIPHTSATTATNIVFGLATWLISLVIDAIVLARLRPILCDQSSARNQRNVLIC
jgi:hypothetical protein